MRRILIGAAVVATTAGLVGVMPAGASGATGASGASATPRWMLHVQKYPGGVSAGVRAMVSPEAAAAQAKYGRQTNTLQPLAVTSGPNVQMNTDSNPPLPQNETAVDYSISNPMVAVAASNDYVSGGLAIMHTANGGRSWGTTRLTPQFDGTGDFCSGGDPTVAYSLRDRAFYLSQLCFFRSQAYSEVHVYKSVDNGRTWTPGRQRALAASNFDYTKGTVNDAVFNDHEQITVDNNPTSRHYGRLYVTYQRFHLQPNGFSDYCPVRLSYTDVIPTFNPALSVFQHSAVVPAQPGGPGKGESANQGSLPRVERDGTLDVSYVLEDCNTGLDRGFRLQKSADGGASFMAHPVRIDKPGQFRDNPNLDDTLPPTAFRAPNFGVLDYNQHTGTLTYVYQNNITRAATGADISYQQSRNGGLSWSNTRFLSHARNDQFFPWVSSDRAGRIYAIWYDRRLDPHNVNIDTWQAMSANDGRTWSQHRISTQSWNPNHGFFTSGAFIGDYIGLAASNKAVYPVWTDGRHSAIRKTGIGETDIFTNVEIRR